MVLNIIIKRYWASKSKPKEGYNEIADLLKPISDSQKKAKGDRVMDDKLKRGFLCTVVLVLASIVTVCFVWHWLTLRGP